MPKPGHSRDAVLAEAAKLADERGLDRLSLAELAARLKIQPPSLYNHIDSLDSARRDLAILALERLGAALAKAAIGKSGDEAVRAIAASYRGFVKKHPGLYQATVRAADPDDDEMKRADSSVVEVCLAVLGAYRLDEERAIHALRGLRSAVHGFAMLEISGGFAMPVDIDRSFEWLVDCCIAGMHAQAESKKDSRP
jgi:AcrR family transcriptional regulator